jgi:hypothetical protein
MTRVDRLSTYSRLSWSLRPSAGVGPPVSAAVHKRSLTTNAVLGCKLRLTLGDSARRRRSRRLGGATSRSMHELVRHPDQDLWPANHQLNRVTGLFPRPLGLDAPQTGHKSGLGLGGMRRIHRGEEERSMGYALEPSPQ